MPRSVLFPAMIAFLALVETRAEAQEAQPTTGIDDERPRETESPRPPTRREPHAPGFFVRLLSDAGYAHYAESTSEGAMRIHGATFGLTSSIGGTISERIALHVDAGLARTTASSVSFDDLSANVDLSIVDVTIDLGATRHFAANGYFSFGIGTGVSLLSSNATTNTGMSGFGLHTTGTLGKEWLISNRIGAGFALRISYLRAPDEDYLHAVHATLGASFTTN